VTDRLVLDNAAKVWEADLDHKGGLTMPEINGSCRCGKVTYSSTADPVFVGICHCASCQKRTGSAFGSALAVPADSLKVTGTTKRFDDFGDSGKPIHSVFCPECGSTITNSADVMPGITMVAVGTLDDSSWVRPAMQIYCESAMPWATIAGLQSFPKMPG
jgi:hypothetical protein